VGKVAVATGTATATEQWPPGHEYDYTQITADKSVTATTEGAADTVITGGSATFDGGAVIVEFFSPYVKADTTSAGRLIAICLFMDGSVIDGFWAIKDNIAAVSNRSPVSLRRRYTPSAGSHSFVVKAWVSAGTAIVGAGAGGSGAGSPAFLRVVKA
jgi:hypothetical protein